MTALTTAQAHLLSGTKAAVAGAPIGAVAAAAGSRSTTGRIQPTAASRISFKISAAEPFRHLRHACGFALANKGHDTRALQAYLGHKNIQHTVRYTELSPDRFKDFWR